MDARGGTPQHILGLPIRSHTRIYVSYLIPSCLELFVYIVQFFADCAVSFQHFRYGQLFYGWITLTLVLAPPVLCFIFVMTSNEQWSNPRHANKTKFIAFQVSSLLLFPIFAAYRFSRRIFWSIEALFHDDDDTERMFCLAKAGECSTCELYHLIQAYVQSGPQIILQLYHMLTQDLFRNYNTTTVQAISLVFATIDLAAITVTYQRFESQKLAGRPYPWAAPSQIEIQKQRLIAADRLRKENERKRRESERKISDFPESIKIMENFKLRHSDGSENHHQNKIDKSNKTPNDDDAVAPGISVIGHDEVDNNSQSQNTEFSPANSNANSTDDEKIQSNSPKLPKYFPNTSLNAIETCDMAPETPPPLPPPELRTQTSTTTELTGGAKNRLSAMANRISTLKDMLWLNAQLYITENVPRPPKMLTARLHEPSSPDHDDDGRDVPPSFQPPPPPVPSIPSPSTSTCHQSKPLDEIDFFIPRPYRVIKGIEQDDFAAKTVAFLGWLAFICMRMLALSTFCVFFTRPFLILIGAHYVLMLFWLLVESKFQDKLNRTLFYILLAYVYLFVILEFRIKFRNIRVWYVCYLFLTIAENLVMTFSWWLFGEFESWWFGFMYDTIMWSGVIFVSTLIVYYCLMRPRDVIYLLPEDDDFDK